MARIILGITGSIAAYKALEVLRLLRKAGHDVIPVMTESATKLITPLTVETLAGGPCYVYTFPEKRQFNPEHIAIARQSDLMVTAPATANIIAKYRWGIADDLLSLTALTWGLPHIIAPAMNLRMFANPIYKENETYLAQHGYELISPVYGSLADGETGMGKLAPVEEIFDRIVSRLGTMLELKGKTVLVSAGGNREMIDSVRCITNLSSGKMGYAMAREASHRGADIVLVTASDEAPDFPCRVVRAVSNAEMKSAIEREFPGCDILAMAAAVSDFTPSKPVVGKIERASGPVTIELKPTDDILAGLKPLKGNKVVIGFAAEAGIDRARIDRKLESKGVDYLVVNDISRTDIGFSSDENEVEIYRPGMEPVHISKAGKDEVARKIWDEIKQK